MRYEIQTRGADEANTRKPLAHTGERGAGRSLALLSQCEALGSLSPSINRAAGALDASDIDALDEYSIRQLLELFEILDRWDREAHGSQAM